MWNKPAVRVVALAAILLSAAGCSTSTVVSDACLGFEAMTYSPHDTDETIEQIIGHNAAYEALDCE